MHPYVAQITHGLAMMSDLFTSNKSIQTIASKPCAIYLFYFAKHTTFRCTCIIKKLDPLQSDSCVRQRFGVTYFVVYNS
jgi:hypothetical protein